MFDQYLKGAFVSIVVIFIFFNFFYFVALKLKNNSIVDILWGIGFIVNALAIAIYNREFSLTNVILTALVTLWGARLATHIFLRNFNKPEDFRYANWRKTWKHFYIRSYFQIFLLQGFMMFVISIPVTIINTNSLDKLNILTSIGIAIWSIGFIFESIGDFQLTEFLKQKRLRSNDKNFPRIMKTGLWKYTRHPNYFGEATLWWGIFLIGLNFEYGFIGIISPILIDFLLLKVSGIPMLEKKYAGDLEFEEYKKVTSAFFPLPRNLKISFK